ncbi:hypothetical protein DB30_02667 [Enhygromyxa salina]|uniref:RNA polymerase sigma factor 70 region 4 type 2 domain-containing protein n=1 Tax=Enhygromyxa salina TaxID=215803 RepID=A0A0C2D8E9_9BACT|nr:sigma-70 family RNA polymerase sigma factor [Enhygromyxa salina]KIG19386.1 hypothetical protein DB30_02667 [Enhygromyxa salina]
MLDHQKLLDGDPSATSQFVMVARQWARRFFRKRSQLDGVIQSAMIEMLAKLRAGNIPEPERMFFWVLSCTNNAVRRELTRVRNNRVVGCESARHCLSAAGPSERVRARDELQRVDALLEVCDASARRIIEARAYGYTYREIADELNLGPAAVRASVSRLRKKLVAQLESQRHREDLRRQAVQAMLKRHRQLPPRSDSSSSNSSGTARR